MKYFDGYLLMSIMIKCNWMEIWSIYILGLFIWSKISVKGESEVQRLTLFQRRLSRTSELLILSFSSLKISDNNLFIRWSIAAYFQSISVFQINSMHKRFDFHNGWSNFHGLVNRFDQSDFVSPSLSLSHHNDLSVVVTDFSRNNESYVSIMHGFSFFAVYCLSRFSLSF